MKRRNAALSLVAALAAGAVVSALAVERKPPELLMHFDNDVLRITAPRLDFLSGKSLQRLKDGASLAFVGQLSLSSSPAYVIAGARSVARFAVSYDIWEERFSVTRLAAGSEPKRSVSHLSVQGAQDWCLGNLSLTRAQVPADKPFFLQLDLRVENPKDTFGIIDDSGISITRLLELFSAPAREKQSTWYLSGGPYTLDDFRKAGGG